MMRTGIFFSWYSIQWYIVTSRGTLRIFFNVLCMCMSIQVVLPPASLLLVYNKKTNAGNISFTSELNTLEHVHLSWGKNCV